MIKRLLVCFIVIFAFCLRADEAKNIERVIVDKKENPQIQKFLDEEMSFDSVKYNVYWTYNRSFINQDSVAYEEYLEDVLNGEKTRKAFDYERAMELTMYYLGFDENIFHCLCWDIPPDALYYDVPDYFLVHPRKEIRNLEKAKYWASKIKDLNPPAYESRWALPVFLLACEMEGILESTNYSKLNYLIVNSDNYEATAYKTISRIEEIEKENPSDRLSKKKESIYKALEDYKQRRYGEIYIENTYNFFWKPIIAYAYYRGFGVEKDFKKAKEYIFMLPPNVWRIFWAGWLVPKDQEFAIYILRLHNTPYSKAQLKRIESGFYDER